MAEIDNLRERILSENREKAQEIETEAGLTARELLKNAELQAERILDEIRSRAERDGKDKKDRIISKASLEARNSILFAKQDIIDRVLEHVLEKIDAMNDAEYYFFIEKLLLNSAETGDEEVIFSKRDRNRINDKLISNANRNLKAMGKKGELKISSETRNISAGFILKRGGLEINCTMESQIRLLRGSLEVEIANLLFEKMTS